MEALLDETAKILLPRMVSPEKFTSMLQNRADVLTDKVCAENGVWMRIVEQSFDQANLIHLGNSRDGYHNPSEFVRPRRQAVKEALRLRVLYWKGRAWNRFAAKRSQEENRLRAPMQGDRPKT